MLRSGWARVPQLLSLLSRAREPQLLSPRTTTTKAACLQPVLRGRRRHDSEEPPHRGEEWPPLAAAGEGLRAAAKTQRSQK